MKAHVSLACWPGLSVDAAVSYLSSAVEEPLVGALSAAHVQLVPQSRGQLTEGVVDGLLEAFPDVSFRLHANVRVLPDHRFADLANFEAQHEWFYSAAAISQRLGAPAYTAHAGHRRDATLAELLDNARRCADLFQCPVGIEGMYPASGDPWLVSTWPEYRALLDSGVPYALDLSHLNILTCQSGQRDDVLVGELLASPACIEVHVSGNDGDRDSHRVVQGPTWWWPLLDHAHPDAVLFSEGNHGRNLS